MCRSLVWHLERTTLIAWHNALDASCLRIYKLWMDSCFVLDVPQSYSCPTRPGS
jgi:hypothetical protein